jgi:hypothetical protein
MSLEQSSSKEALGKNIATEENAGKPPAQAEAIAFATQRKNEDESYHQVNPDMTLAKLNDANRKAWCK